MCCFAHVCARVHVPVDPSSVLARSCGVNLVRRGAHHWRARQCCWIPRCTSTGRFGHMTSKIYVFVLEYAYGVMLQCTCALPAVSWPSDWSTSRSRPSKERACAVHSTHVCTNMYVCALPTHKIASTIRRAGGLCAVLEDQPIRWCTRGSQQHSFGTSGGSCSAVTTAAATATASCFCCSRRSSSFRWGDVHEDERHVVH